MRDAIRPACWDASPCQRTFRSLPGQLVRYTPVESAIVPLPDLAMTVSMLHRIIEAVDDHLEPLGVRRSALGGRQLDDLGFHPS